MPQRRRSIGDQDQPANGKRTGLWGAKGEVRETAANADEVAPLTRGHTFFPPTP